MKLINILHQSMRLALLLIALVLVFPLCAQNVKVIAPSVVALDDYFELRYVVENEDVDGITLEDLNDFLCLSGPNQSTSQSFQFINGKSSHTSTVSYTYILQPKAKGTFTIPSAILKIGGKKVRAKSVELTVTEAQQSSSSSRSSSSQRQQRRANRRQTVPVQEITEKDLFVRVTPSKTKVKEQEAVELTYSVYSRLGVGLSQVALAKTPDFKGLLAHDIQMEAMDVKVEDIDGVTYKVTDCLKYIVFPQTQGKISISPLMFECQVVQNDPTMDLMDAFFNGGMVSKVLKRSAQKITLNVEPLPQDKPINFSGVVGDLQIKGELLSTHLRTNEMCHYRITVSGTGNLKLMLPPTVNFPEDFDCYEVKTTEDLQLTAHGHRGKVVYDYTFVPNHIGTYTLPETRFSYFDIKANQFVECATESLELNIKQGAQSSTNVKRDADLSVADIRTIHQGDVVLKNPAAWIKWGAALYWCFLAFLLIVMLLCSWKRKQVRAFFTDNSARIQQKAGKQATKRLRKAKDALEHKSTDDFYVVLHDAMQQYLMNKFTLTKAEMNKTSVIDKLQTSQVEAQTIQDLISVLETCEYARFAPSADDAQRTSLYERAVRVIDQLEK
ncbi:MAG: protein BatD [Bacteroidaceae bacterium]|nr:protein BatD [Bacteroidaceae bacterium]